MSDDIINDILNITGIKKWFKKYYKFLIVFLLYIMYQLGFVYLLLDQFGIDISKISKTPRIFLFTFCDLIYVIILLLMFKNEIIRGLKNLKKNFLTQAITSLQCWILGCLIMGISSIIIGFILKQDVSTNEQLVRDNIKLAPLYMLFTCSIVAPIFEELVFRRSIRAFIKYKWLYIIISGFGFGLLHVIGNYTTPFDFLYVIPYGAMGSCFAYLFCKTDNITLPIIIHMMHNTILVLSQTIGGK